MTAGGRLSRVLEIIPPCNIFADIGCDHGKLALAAVKKGKAKRALLSDISAKCLQKARLLFEQNGITDARFYCGDGLNALDTAPDVAVLAGMGGREIMSIIDKSPYLCPTYILQPMKHTSQLRGFLIERGYTIIYDCCVYENPSYYDIIRADYTGKAQPLTALQQLFGITNLKTMHEDFIDYLDYRITSARNILSGGVKGKRRAELEYLLQQALSVRGEKTGTDERTQEFDD